MNHETISGHTVRLFKTPESIQARVQEIGQALAQTFEHRNPLVIGILSGAFVFLADLIRVMSISMDVDFWRVASYGSGTQSSGHLAEPWPILVDVEGRHVIVVEDIVDSGRTIEYIRRGLGKRRAASITIVSMLQARKSEISVDYTGFSCGPQFVVGYGLDIGGQLRNLPALYYLEG